MRSFSSSNVNSWVGKMDRGVSAVFDLDLTSSDPRGSGLDKRTIICSVCVGPLSCLSVFPVIAVILSLIRL